MPSNEMIPLLSLQERDLQYQRAKSSLRSIPVEREAVRKKIHLSEQRVEQARAEVRKKELERERFSSEAEAAQDKMNRFKTQQLSVKKNEEYEALSHEIQNMEERIGSLEDKELEALEAIDMARSSLREEEAGSAKEIALWEKDLEKIQKQEEEMQGGLDQLKATVEKMRKEVVPELLETYDQLSRQIKRPPVVVPLVKQICVGCHLRVSNEVEAKVQNFQAVCCDQCGRLLYLE